MTRTRLAAAAASLAALLLVTCPSQAATRAWVSGHGTDTGGCGAPTAPCRSLQYAHDNIVAPGGEIDILDPAGYGAILITKAISIINDGVGTAGVQQTTPGQAGVLISAGPNDAITLRGLDIEGLGAGANGVYVTSGASVSIEDSTVKGFTFANILFTPTTLAWLYVSNTRVTQGADVGVYVHPLVASGSGLIQASFEHLEVVDNAFDGVFVDGRQSASGVTVKATLGDSVLANDGVAAHSVSALGAAPVTLVVRNTTLSDNNAFGALAEVNTTLDVASSTLSGNATAFQGNVGAFLGSLGDNNVDGNASFGTTPTAIARQ